MKMERVTVCGLLGRLQRLCMFFYVKKYHGQILSVINSPPCVSSLQGMKLDAYLSESVAVFDIQY